MRNGVILDELFNQIVKIIFIVSLRHVLIFRLVCSIVIMN